MAEGHDVGRTARSGYQIGVRRTLPCTEEQLWGLLLSSSGLKIWLGGPAEIAPGAAYTLADGTTGEIRVYRPWSHMRLTWQPPDWAAPSTLQVRVIPAGRGTTLSVHQEGLAGAAERTAMRSHWEQVIEQLAERLARSGAAAGKAGRPE